MKKLSDISDQEWSFISTCISADIMENKIILNSKKLKEIFCGKDPIDAEDLLADLVEPIDWEAYLEEAISQGYSWQPFVDKLHKTTTLENTLFCRICEFEGVKAEFNFDEASNEISCPECTSLSIGVRRYLEIEPDDKALKAIKE